MRGRRSSRMRAALAIGVVALSAAALPAIGWAQAAGVAPPPDKTAPDVTAPDMATRFGAMPAVETIAISPDGRRIAYVGGGAGPATAAWTIEIGATEPNRAMAADGKPLRLTSCSWVAAKRLICEIGAVQMVEHMVLGASRLVAVDADGGHVKLVSQGGSTYGGDLLDLLPDEEDAVLIAQGGLTRLDTRTGKSAPAADQPDMSGQYFTDGHGHVRVIGQATFTPDNYIDAVIHYFYRKPNGRGVLPLGSYDRVTKAGFRPLAVDPGADVIYGLKKLDGRQALYTLKLDGTLAGKLVLANDTVDIDDVVTVGRDRRIVGARYVTEKRHVVYFDPQFEALVTSLRKALPAAAQIDVIDASKDGGVMLVRASGDTDPGSYYVFDRAARRLNRTILERPLLEGVPLAHVTPIAYPAADGTVIPGYLTLPPGKDSPRGLPALVMPHGGPDARDEWGFDWLAQYFAARGYAVLQPNYRGSAGYGDAWFVKNGFKSWRVAVGDIVDAGRWFVGQGVDPAHLAIFGWSYGGYAALQSGVIAPGLFKAIVAVAPVTDLRRAINDAHDFMNYRLTQDMFGTGPYLQQGSPAQNAAAIVAPVLMFHGDTDQNVGVGQSRLMDQRLKAAGRRSTLVVYPGLQHSLFDGTVRADLLRRSDAFLRASMKL